MRVTLRSKLFGIAASATLALTLIAVVGLVAASQVKQQLDEIRTRLIPRIELRPRLEADLERLARTFQDAAAAQDRELLMQADERRKTLLARLAGAQDAVNPNASIELRKAVDDYFTSAAEVSRWLIAGKTGADVVASMEKMQKRQAHARQLIEAVSDLRPGELETAFARTVALEERSLRLQLGSGLACVLAVALMTLLIARQVMRSVTELSLGLERFGRGELDQPIVLHGDDELTQVARRANDMATNLDALSHARDRMVWLAEGLNGLSVELRGELTEQECADRATAFLARYLKAPAGALYYEDGPELRLIGRYAVSDGDKEGGGGSWVRSFRSGEGFVGQAAQAREPMVIESLPADYLRVGSGLGQTAPTALVLLPLLPADEVKGVLELAFLGKVPEAAEELLASAQRSIAIAIEVARARAASRALLAETQAQAARLAAQEEELRATNEELEAQQEELRQANEELIQQANALDEHRKALEQSNRELENARRTLELRADELATISAYKSQFLANMSHELRTPLNSMLLLSNLLSENQGGDLTDKQVEYCRTIHSAGQELLGLINQVLDLAKIEAGKVELELARVELRELADYLGTSFSPLAQNKGLDFEIVLDAGLPDAIVTERQRTLQILNNLIANAIKFTDTGTVTLRMYRPPPGADVGRPDLVPAETVALEVTDTGPGIAPEHQGRVFAAFEQADASIRRRHGGTGLGLAISRELAQQLGGTLALRSAQGAGCTFTCYLPEHGPKQSTSAGARPDVAMQRAPAATAAPAAREPRGSGLLVVEDDAAFAESLVEIIRKQGHDARLASSGEAALRLAREHKPRGIILDVMLPDMDGWTVLQRLREDPETASIPVHCVSGLDGAARAASLGAVGYVRKPATREDLLRVVDALAPKPRGRATKILVVEDDAIMGDSLVVQLAKEDIHARRVGTAQAAIAALRDEPFDCLILDLGLPDMDGLELIEQIDRVRTGRLPSVIVYTARALSIAETRRLETYADAIVLKEGSSVERLLNEIRMFAGRLAGTAQPKSATQLATTAALRGKTVLVVDDDMRTLYALSAMLRSKGFDVHSADTGVAALEVLEKRDGIDIVLMDIMMPEMDGYAAMQRIRSQPRFAKLPIIALTAKAMKGDEDKCLEAGANAYLPKPIDSERLLETLRAHLVDRS